MVFCLIFSVDKRRTAQATLENHTTIQIKGGSLSMLNSKQEHQRHKRPTNSGRFTLRPSMEQHAIRFHRIIPPNRIFRLSPKIKLRSPVS